MANKLTINELVKQASNSVQEKQESIVKTAAEQGIEDADRVVKVASYTGSIMGSTAFDAFHDCVAASLDFNPEDAVVKQASIADMLDATIENILMEKIAEAYSSQTGGENLVTTQMAAADQVVEQGKANAVLAAQSAQDALSSVDMGDANTAAQSMATAGQNITLAQQALAVAPDPELEAQVAEASDVVAQAAQAIQGVMGAPASAENPVLQPDVSPAVAAEMADAEAAVAQ